jgi:hypothetical protein
MPTFSTRAQPRAPIRVCCAISNWSITGLYSDKLAIQFCASKGLGKCKWAVVRMMECAGLVDVQIAWVTIAPLRTRILMFCSNEAIRSILRVINDKRCTRDLM